MKYSRKRGGAVGLKVLLYNLQIVLDRITELEGAIRLGEEIMSDPSYPYDKTHIPIAIQRNKQQLEEIKYKLEHSYVPLLTINVQLELPKGTEESRRNLDNINNYLIDIRNLLHPVPSPPIVWEEGTKGGRKSRKYRR